MCEALSLIPSIIVVVGGEQEKEKKLQTGRIYLQKRYLIKDYYTKYTKNQKKLNHKKINSPINKWVKP
jgi:hypothetical protein